MPTGQLAVPAPLRRMRIRGVYTVGWHSDGHRLNRPVRRHLAAACHRMPIKSAHPATHGPPHGTPPMMHRQLHRNASPRACLPGCLRWRSVVVRYSPPRGCPVIPVCCWPLRQVVRRGRGEGDERGTGASDAVAQERAASEQLTHMGVLSVTVRNTTQTPSRLRLLHTCRGGIAIGCVSRRATPANPLYARWTLYPTDAAWAGLTRMGMVRLTRQDPDRGGKFVATRIT